MCVCVCVGVCVRVCITITITIIHSDIWFNETVFNYTFLNNYVHSHGNYIRTYTSLACNCQQTYIPHLMMIITSLNVVYMDYINSLYNKQRREKYPKEEYVERVTEYKACVKKIIYII